MSCRYKTERSSQPAAQIELKNVELSSGAMLRGFTSLKGISLAIEAGEAVGLVGPSGSGKSSLLMVMAGLERADSGSVVIEGTDLSKMAKISWRSSAAAASASSSSPSTSCRP